MRLKNILKALPIVLGLSIFAACEERDEISDRNRLYRLEQRVSKLEDLCEIINKNCENIKKLLQEQAKNVSINSVYKMQDGYVIAFTDGEFVEIHNGKDGKDGKDGTGSGEGGSSYVPKIGVKLFEGKHYWTVDGEWLLDEKGNKVCAEGQDGKDGQDGQDGQGGGGTTPQMKIENGFWMVSYDDGKTWEVLGKATGEDGKDGADGIAPELRIENGVWYISYDKGVTWEAIGTATGEDGKTPSLKIEDGNLMISYDGGVTWSIVEGSNGQFGGDGGGTSGGETIGGHTAVDLGLPSGKKWASCNIGANKPEQYGEYFAWGDTASKADYSPNTTRTFGKTPEQLALLNYTNKSTGALETNFDVAQHKWGEGWRMPTREEFQELLTYCKWTWTKVGNISGYKVESKADDNTNSIFLPAAGMMEDREPKNQGVHGWYWASVPFAGNDYLSWNLEFSENEDYGLSTLSRRCGFTVRAIYGRK